MSRIKTNGNSAPATRPGLVAALDVGSSKIACIIGRADSTGLKVLGSAVHESRGIKSGAVTSLELAEESIREAVDRAEQLADHRIQDVILSVQCGQPRSLTARAERVLGGALVTDAHLRDIIAEGKRNCRAEGCETIQASPASYVIDQSRGVRDPRGMFCERLGVTVHAVAVPAGPLHNLRLAVERCHLTIARQLCAPYASALSTLAPDETSLGATLIDFGAGVTAVAVFMEGALIHVDSIPLGGAHITSDIAKMFSTPLGAAERIKSLYGSTLGDTESGTDMIEVPQIGEEGEESNQRIKRSLLTRVIQSRMEEILTHVRDRLRATGFDVAAGRRAVLTGGGCQLAGARELTERVLNKKARIARPTAFPGLAAANAGPAYSTALGLLIAGATTAPEVLDPNAHAETRQGKRGLARLFGASLFG
ncbi:MAG TPA: cell division protein FtsA [Rhizomicrobium sp.]|nr:cell division protein FtsA [Rhizomicrobium sp.]